MKTNICKPVSQEIIGLEGSDQSGPLRWMDVSDYFRFLILTGSKLYLRIFQVLN